VESIRFGQVPGEAMALVYVAADRKLFSRNGLEVTFKEYDTIAALTGALTQGEVDLVLTGEFVIVDQVLQGNRIQVIANVAKSLLWFIIGRQDRGIEKITDLKGKRIGMTQRGSESFYLVRFLDQHGLDLQDVNLVLLTGSQWMGAITEGSVDAVLARRPDVKPLQERLKAGAAIWPAQGNQPIYDVISGRNDWIARYPDLVKRILKSLYQAEQFLVYHPQETQEIVRKRLRSDAASLKSIWPEYEFSLSLDLSLVTVMTAEARWMIANRLSGEKTPPDFLDYVYVEGLAAVKPETVNIHRDRTGQ
jgi:NitT/TauT family transport system substrate-binding protein